MGHILRKQERVQREIRGEVERCSLVPGTEPGSLWTLFRKQRGIAEKGAALPWGADVSSLASNTRCLGEQAGARVFPSNLQHTYYIPVCLVCTRNLRNRSTTNSLPSEGVTLITFFPPVLAWLAKHSQSPLAPKVCPSLTAVRVRPQASSSRMLKEGSNEKTDICKNKPDLGSLTGKWKWERYPTYDGPEQAQDHQAATQNKFFPGWTCLYVSLIQTLGLRVSVIQWRSTASSLPPNRCLD